jgi:hypothetical protein
MAKHADQSDNFTSCEIIQEIYGLGPYNLLHENEEAIFERLMLRYNKRSTRVGDKSIERLIRETISYRRAETTGNFPRRKDSMLSNPPRTSSGTDRKAVEGSERAPRRIGLG